MQTAAKTIIKPNDPFIQYMGRVDRSLPDKVRFDWPGITIGMQFSGTSCQAILAGEACFSVYIDDTLITTLTTDTQKKCYRCASGLPDTHHNLLLVKRSESSVTPSIFEGFLLDDEKAAIALPPQPKRKILFIGDSYTAGFAHEYHTRECPAEKTDSVILATTNAYTAFGALVARALGAQFHCIARSGKGLVRNYNGSDQGHEYLAYFDQTLLTSVAGAQQPVPWDFTSWRPDVIVIGLGINDFQGNPPYADSMHFTTAYQALIAQLSTSYPHTAIICSATPVWPQNNLISIIKRIVQIETAAGKKRLFYHEYTTANNALYGHPNSEDHRLIAQDLLPIVAKATEWQTATTGTVR